MLYIKVSGITLDVPADTKCSFVKENNMITGTLKGERSTSVKIPTTAKNLQVFGEQTCLQLAANVTRHRGADKLAAEICVDGIVFGGYLYLLSATKTELSVGVVFGEAFAALVDYKDAKLKDIFAANTAYTEGGGVGATASAPSVWSVARYYNHAVNYNVKMLMPSVSLLTLLQTKFTVSGYTAEMAADRWLPEKIEGAADIATVLKVDNNGEIVADANFTRLFKKVNTMLTYAVEDYPVSIPSAPSFTNTPLECFAVRDGAESVSLQFGFDIDDDVFLMQVTEFDDVNNADVLQEFHGDYSFDIEYKGEQNPTRAVYGIPLKGRKVTIPKYLADEETEAYFTFIKKSWWHNESWLYAGDTRHRGLYGYDNFVGSEHSVTAGAEVDGVAILDSTDKIYLADNLPDITLSDLLQIWCNVYNVHVDGTAQDIVFVSNSVVAVEDLRGVLSVANIQRRFRDYKQNNVVRFDSDNDVSPSVQISETYVCQSNVLETENEIYKVKASEGGVIMVNNDARLWRNDIIAPLELDDDYNPVRTYQSNASKPCLFRTATVGGVATGYRVNMERDGVRENLVTNLQQIEVTALMTFAEFQALENTTALRFWGQKWLWSEAKWQEGKVTLTLHRYTGAI